MNNISKAGDRASPASFCLADIASAGSVFPEHVLDYLGVGGLRQRQFQQYARLLWVEVVAGDPVVFVVRLFAVASDDAGADARGADDDDPRLAGGVERIDHLLRDGTVAGTGVNDAFGAGLDEGVESDRIFVVISVDDVDLREGIETADVELGVRGVETG